MHFDAGHKSHFFPPNFYLLFQYFLLNHPPFPLLVWNATIPIPSVGGSLCFTYRLFLCYYHTYSTFHSFSNVKSGRTSAPTSGFSFLFSIQMHLELFCPVPKVLLAFWVRGIYILICGELLGFRVNSASFRVSPSPLTTWQPLSSHFPWLVLGIYLNTMFISFQSSNSVKSMGLFGLCIPGF